MTLQRIGHSYNGQTRSDGFDVEIRKVDEQTGIACMTSVANQKEYMGEVDIAGFVSMDDAAARVTVDEGLMAEPDDFTDRVEEWNRLVALWKRTPCGVES